MSHLHQSQIIRHLSSPIFIICSLFILHLVYANEPALSAEKETFTIDTDKSEIRWLGKKLAGKHNGSVRLRSGSVALTEGMITEGTFVIDMLSIMNEDIESPQWRKKLEDHLKSADFFNVSTFPEGTFAIKGSEKQASDTVLIRGDLTIKGISLPVSLVASISQKGDVYVATGKATIDRKKWDIRYNSGKWFDPATLGDKLIYDDIEIEVTIVTLPSS
jgi:polyisoprenoid-binding protein YceI